MRTKFFDLPLRFQIIIPFSLLIIALAGVALGFGLPLAKRATSENVDLKLDSARSLLLRALDHESSALQRSAALVAQTPELAGEVALGDRQRLSEVLEASQPGPLDALQITGVEGHTLAAAGGHAPLEAAALASLGRTADDEGATGIISSQAGLMLAAISPVGPPEAPLGFVAAGRLVNRLLQSLKPSPGTELAIYQDGRLAATTFSSSHGQPADLVSPPSTLSMASEPVKKGSVVDGHPYATIYDRLPLDADSATAFAVFVPKSQVWPTDVLVAGSVAAALAVPLILLILGFAIARAIAARLERVVEAIESIGDGDFQQRVDLNSADEVGRLAQMVNRMAARLQDAETSKAEFLAMASHELRTPLALIHSATELLLDEAPRQGDTPRQELLQIIAGNIDRMNRRVADLLDLARLEAGHLTIRKRPVDLVPLVSEVAESVGPMLAAKEQRLSLALPPALPSVSADPDRIQQALLNLLTNAARHTGPKTHIAMRASQNGQSVTVEVEDDGQGIPQGRLERLLDGTRRPQAGDGAGLGLLIAQRLVALHGGRLWARSDPGRATVFAFSLPLAPAEGR